MSHVSASSRRLLGASNFRDGASYVPEIAGTKLVGAIARYVISMRCIENYTIASWASGAKKGIQ